MSNESKISGQQFGKGNRTFGSVDNLPADIQALLRKHGIEKGGNQLDKINPATEMKSKVSGEKDAGTSTQLGKWIEIVDQDPQTGVVVVAKNGVLSSVSNAHEVRKTFPDGGTITLAFDRVYPDFKNNPNFKDSAFSGVQLVGLNPSANEESLEIDEPLGGNFFLRGLWEVASTNETGNKFEVAFKKIDQAVE